MQMKAVLFSASEYLDSLAYPKPTLDLSGVRYDILAIEKRLNQIGFSVEKKENAFKDDYIPLLQQSVERVPTDAVHIVYFSGHGGHYNGKNYIYPADFAVRYDESKDLDAASINIEDIISVFKGKGRLILILDACRSDFGLSKGYYSEMASSENVYIAYGTMFQAESIGVKGGLSWFTEAICDEILTPNIDVDTLFTRVRQNVFNKHYTQIPPSVNALLDKVVLHSELNYSNIDKQVYDFIEKYGDEYTDKYGYFHGDDLIFIDAAQYFNIGLLDAIWMFKKVDNKICKDKGINLPELSETEAKLVSFLGFSRGEKFFTFDESHTWYYNGRQIRMGEIPPLPPSMQRKLPEQDKEIQIEGDITCNVDNNKLYFTLSSNIPDDTPLISTLKGRNYRAQSKSIVVNKEAVFGGFSNCNQFLIDGIYEFIITCPIYSVMPESVKSIFGEDNRNLIGKYVEYNPIGGNTIKMIFNCSVNDTTVNIL